MRRLRPISLTTLGYWLWALALISLAIFAATSTRRIQGDLERREYARVLASTEHDMELWERQVLDATTGWLSALEQAGDVALLQEQARELSPWVDSFYLWDTRTGEIIHPTPTSSDTDDAKRGCLLAAEADGPLLPSTVAASRYLSCLPAPPSLEMLATSRAALLLMQAGRPGPARRALLAGQTPAGLSLQAGMERGITPSDLAAWRLLHLRIMAGLGLREEARTEGLTLAAQAAALDGPQLEDMLDATIPGLLERLPGLATPLEIAEFEASFEVAKRRADAWAEVQDRLSRRSDLPAHDELPNLLKDPYGLPPFLLLYRRLDDGRTAAAVQMDEDVLVERLTTVIGESHERAVKIEDGSGRHIAGSLWSAEKGRLLTFPLVFEYLRVGLPPLRHQVPPRERNKLLFLQLAPFGLTVLLGALALGALAAASRRRLELETRRREFVTRVTHELKTPLAGIRVMAEVLELGAYRDAFERTEVAQRIVKESERLAVRVDEVLSMARDPGDFTRQLVDPAELCREVADRWSDLMEQNGIRLELRIGELPQVLADRAMLRDALGAMLDNAIKYRHPRRHARVQLKAIASGRRWLQFEVSDNGLGVPAAMRRAIFEPFTRVESPGRGTAGGHGLGLSFVANAARVHRGRVEFRVGPEGGSRFILRIRR